MPGRWILLVLEDGIFSKESVCYAVKLAKRMDCAISVLMLTGNSSESLENDFLHDTINHAIQMIESEGVSAEGTSSHGDKASVFLKHLALNSSMSAIVWGGSEEIDKPSVRKKGNSWFAKVKSSVLCPVVQPHIKDGRKKNRKKFKRI